jgi:hypothetical protein
VGLLFIRRPSGRLFAFWTVQRMPLAASSRPIRHRSVLKIAQCWCISKSPLESTLTDLYQNKEF